MGISSDFAFSFRLFKMFSLVVVKDYHHVMSLKQLRDKTVLGWIMIHELAWCQYYIDFNIFREIDWSAFDLGGIVYYTIFNHPCFSFVSVFSVLVLAVMFNDDCFTWSLPKILKLLQFYLSNHRQRFCDFWSLYPFLAISFFQRFTDFF